MSTLGGSWQIEADDDRFVLHRSWVRLLAAYALLLVVTIAWYPLAGRVLAALAVAPASGPALAAFAAPIVGLALWVPRLARERRRIAIVRDAVTVAIDRVRIPRARLDSVAVVHVRAWTGQRRCGVLVLLAQPSAVVPVVDERDPRDAQRIASELAGWLELPVHRDGPPAREHGLPRAIVVDPRRGPAVR